MASIKRNIEGDILEMEMTYSRIIHEGRKYFQKPWPISFDWEISIISHP